jgi:hypothetical protein
MKRNEFNVRRYAEQMSMVGYHGNYAQYFEMGRGMAYIGISYGEKNASVVSQIYKKPSVMMTC